MDQYCCGLPMNHRAFQVPVSKRRLYLGPSFSGHNILPPGQQDVTDHFRKVCLFLILTRRYVCWFWIERKAGGGRGETDMDAREKHPWVASCTLLYSTMIQTMRTLHSALLSTPVVFYIHYECRKHHTKLSSLFMSLNYELLWQNSVSQGESSNYKMWATEWDLPVQKPYVLLERLCTSMERVSLEPY